jgi:predicted lysophospholipase L1 biosynthesis ABC-type transport system permease subunit
VLVIATLGIALALALGAAAPFVIEGLFADVLPVPIAAGLDAGPLGIALAFGYLVTLAFALWPLAVARTVAPTALFRMAAVSGRPIPEPRFLAMIALVPGAAGGAGASSCSTTAISRPGICSGSPPASCCCRGWPPASCGRRRNGCGRGARS